MSKYLYQCDYQFISEQLRNELIHHVHTATDFHKNVSPKGIYDGNNVKRVPLDLFPKIADMVNNCRFKTIAYLFKHMPHVEVPRHVDGTRYGVPRQVSLVIPLSPKVYPPTYYWDSYESENYVDVVRTDERMLPHVINLQEIHSLVNTSDEIRSNLQFSFDESLEVLVEAIKNKTLFKNIREMSL
jgi:hypothetical protein